MFGADFGAIGAKPALPSFTITLGGRRSFVGARKYFLSMVLWKRIKREIVAAGNVPTIPTPVKGWRLLGAERSYRWQASSLSHAAYLNNRCVMFFRKVQILWFRIR